MTQPAIIPIIDGVPQYTPDYSSYEIYIIVGICVFVLIAIMVLARFIKREMLYSDSCRFE